jgi:hypothetical protein
MTYTRSIPFEMWGGFFASKNIALAFLAHKSSDDLGQHCFSVSKHTLKEGIYVAIKFHI